MLYPGNSIKMFNELPANYTIENDEMAQAKEFQGAYFQRLKIKDAFVESAQKILHHIRKTHTKKHNVTKKSTVSKKKILDYIYVGIHSRRTDHLEYEKRYEMTPLDTNYYLEAMHLYRQKFQKHNKQKRLVFVFVSDDLQWGKDKILNRVKERDLYFGGSGLPNMKDGIGQDFALLAHCNHTIESHGSFSYFAGAFAGGFKIKPNHFPKYREPRHRNNKFWTQDPFHHVPPRLSAF